VGTRNRRALGVLVVLAVAVLPACGGRGPATLPTFRTAAVAPPVVQPAAPPPDVPAPAPAAPVVRAVAAAPAVYRPPRTHAAPVARPVVKRASDGLFLVEIPKIGVTAWAHEGQSAAVLARGPGHLPGSAMPGDVGNVVVPGHRTVDPHPFLNIDQLQVGDQIVLTDDAGRFVYEVTGTEVVSPNDNQITASTPYPVVTLYACHPKGSDAQRYVVYARMAGASSQAATPAPSNASQDQSPSSPPAADEPKPRPSCGAVPCMYR